MLGYPYLIVSCDQEETINRLLKKEKVVAAVADRQRKRVVLLVGQPEPHHLCLTEFTVGPDYENSKLCRLPAVKAAIRIGTKCTGRPDLQN
jgi:hypothetical protein